MNGGLLRRLGRIAGIGYSGARSRPVGEQQKLAALHGERLRDLADLRRDSVNGGSERVLGRRVRAARPSAT